MGILSTSTFANLTSGVRSEAAAHEIQDLLAGGGGSGMGENIIQYGASTEAGFDNGPAIRAAIAAACRNGTYQVFIPAGTFEIHESNCLHPQAAGITFAEAVLGGNNASGGGLGIRFIGASQNYSILKLMNNGVDTRWFYDSGTTASPYPGWNRVQFEHIWFLGSGSTNVTADNAYTNGFRICASLPTGGVDKGFIFTCCRNDRLGVPLEFTGTSNTDTYNAYSCWWSTCGPIIIDNDQALLLNWYSCHFWSADDQFWMKATSGNGQQGKGGGGAITCRDCDIIIGNVSGDTTPHYTVRIDDGASFYRTWLFDHCRWELRNPEARLVYWPGTASFITGSEVVFNTCDISQMQQGQAGIGSGANDTNGRRDIIVLGPAKRLVFRNSFLGDQLGVVFQDVNTSNVFAFGYQPIVEFDNCGIPWGFVSGTNSSATAVDATRGLVGRVTLSSGYGRVVGRNCYMRDHTSPENMATDFDYGGRVGGYGEMQAQSKRAELKAGPRAWPGTGNFTRTVRLPEQAIVTGCALYQPASGTSSTSCQRLIAHNRVTITGIVQKPADTECRVTSNGHGLLDGDRVFIEGVTGTTEANGLWTVEGATANTFDLTGSTFTNAYSAGGNAYKVLIESDSARDDAVHRMAQDAKSHPTKFPFVVSTFEDRKFCLISTAGALSKVGGYAYVEYE